MRFWGIQCALVESVEVRLWGTNAHVYYALARLFCAARYNAYVFTAAPLSLCNPWDRPLAPHGCNCTALVYLRRFACALFRYIVT